LDKFTRSSCGFRRTAPDGAPFDAENTWIGVSIRSRAKQRVIGLGTERGCRVGEPQMVTSQNRLRNNAVGLFR